MKSSRAAALPRVFARICAVPAVMALCLPVLATDSDQQPPLQPISSALPESLPSPQAATWSGLADAGGVYPGPVASITTLVESGEPAVSPAWGSYDVRNDRSAITDDDELLEIRLQPVHFDPVREGMNLLPALAVETRGASDSDYHLVQFHGPIRPAWRAALEQTGAEIIEYVPDFAYVVRVASSRSMALSDLDGVRWVGPFAPAFRLAGELVDTALAGRSDDPLELTLRGFAGEPETGLLSQVTAAGAIVVDYTADAGGGVVARVQAPASALLDLASIRALAWIEPRARFAYQNSVSRGNQLIGKDHVEQQLGLYGAGQVVAVVDSGLSTANPATIHADFSGRVLGGGWGSGSCGHWADTNGHGTHVAGSVLGSGARSGSNPAANQYANTQAGIAPKAGLVVWATCDDFSGVPTNPYQALWSPIYAFSNVTRTSNNSWGNTGSAGQYNTFARETDRFVRDYFDMTIVFAAGNDGTDANMDGVSDLGTVMAPSTAKNVITVGASENLRANGGYNPGGNCGFYGECWPDKFFAAPLQGDRLSNHADGMVAFSGRGPTLSNRLKPDIVAPGTNIVSAQSEMTGNTGWGVANQYYQFQGGTSMASPLVAGGVAVVREFFQRGYNHNATAALVKATLLNGAWDMTPGQYGTGPQQDVWRRPDVHQGWGTMNLAGTLVFSANRSSAFFETYPGLQTSQQWQTQVQVGAAGSELRVQLVWIDAAGMEASHGALVNDLDLEVVDPANGIHYGFAGLTGSQRDRFNNLEGVRLASAPAGRYLIRVRGHNVPMGPQPFSIVVTGNLSNDLIFRNGFQSGN